MLVLILLHAKSVVSDEQGMSTPWLTHITTQLALAGHKRA